MPIIPLKCPYCSASLTVDSGKDAAICEFCGTPYVVRDAIVNNYISNVTSINADTVNVYSQKDFDIKGGVLVKYNGESIDVAIPDSVLEIGNSCFKHTKINSVLIPDSVRVIGAKAFSECDNLTSIDIPQSIKTIGDSAFEKCHRLKTISIPKGCVVNSYAFSYCSSLETAYLGDGVVVKKLAFCKTKLTTLFIGEKVKYENDCFLDVGISYVKDINTGKDVDLNKLSYLIEADVDGVNSINAFDTAPFGAKLLSSYAKEHDLCQYCGKRFGGLLMKRCIKCGKVRDY